MTGVYNDRGLHGLMGQLRLPEPNAVGLRRSGPRTGRWRSSCWLLFVAVPKDRARRMVWKFGRRLRGPELVTTAEFNEKLGRKKWLTTYCPDGIAFINLEQTWVRPAAATEPGPLGPRPARARGDALPHRGRLRHGQERGHPAGALADLGARRDGHRVRPGDGISAAVLQRKRGAT